MLPADRNSTAQTRALKSQTYKYLVWALIGFVALAIVLFAF